MQNWGFLVLVIGVFAANLPAVLEQWRTDRPGFIKTLWLMGLYALYMALGFALLLLLAPREGGSAEGAAAGKAVLLTFVQLPYASLE